jgi:ATP-binding cassette subfamily B protein
MTSPGARRLRVGAPADWRGADRLLLRAVGRGGVSVVLLGFSALALAVLELAFPAVLGRALDAALGRASGAWLAWLGALALLLLAVDALDALALGATAARSTAWTRRLLVGHVLSRGARAAGSIPAGDLASRLVGNASDVGRVSADVVRTATTLLTAAGAAVALGLIDMWLCVAFLAVAPLLLLILRAFTREASGAASAYFEVQGRIASRLAEALAGARTIAAAGTVNREVSRILAPLPELQRHGYAVWRAHTRINWQEALLVPLLEIVVLAVAGLRLSGGHITPGQMLAAAEYVAMAAGVGAAVGAVSRLARSRAAARRISSLGEQEPMTYGTLDLPEGTGTLEFRGVGVVAEGRRLLDGVDLVLPAGALVAVVGPSGSGKSLLAALPGRLVDPDEGEVVLDGVSLRQLTRETIRRSVTYGMERPALVGETVADAIAFGASRPPQAVIEEAARAARAHEFIARLPGGYTTKLTDAPMSGGEWQRIGLARAFAHPGRVLVLDDVAASLDTVTERSISRVLTEALAGRTRLVVAHRVSTAAASDLVVWLDRGRIRGVGPHSVLWEEPGYRAVFEPGVRAEASPAGPAEASG